MTKEILEWEVECPVHDSFRVAQLGGMFDLSVAKKSQRRFRVEMPPGLEEDWRIGLIVGPSGSGKSTVAEQLYGESIYRCGNWPSDRAVVDHFGELSLKRITQLLSLVGFSSPPAWVRPYAVLSNGEKFRCDLALALATPELRKTRHRTPEPRDGDFPVVFDEFTSVVDRNVARIASAAVSKGFRTGKLDGRFVAVTCHYDVGEWLEPDWILDMATGETRRGCLRRPRIELRIFRCRNAAWRLFADHHYLSAALHRSARCYLAAWEDQPVAFCAMLPQFGFKDRWRVSRIVILPDYQGVGIGGRFLEALAELYVGNGRRFSITASHPSILRHCERSSKWRCTSIKKSGSKTRNYQSSAGRAVVSFEYGTDAPEKR